MPVALLEVDASNLSLGASKEIGPTTITSILLNGQQPLIQTLPRGRLGDVHTPWEPSVYRGNGDEPRKTITFNVPEDVRSKIEEIDEHFKRVLAFPDDAWTSSIRAGDKYPSSFRAKIRVSGSRPCRFVAEDGSPSLQPARWRNLPVIPILELKGVYRQKRSAGLIWEVAAIMIGEDQADEIPDFL